VPQQRHRTAGRRDPVHRSAIDAGDATRAPESYRQYLGVVIGGRRLIYVNVFPRRPSTGWRTHFVRVCDGGAAFWGVLFDPQARRFFSPQFNGTI
jgi:hypothetical protein